MSQSGKWWFLTAVVVAGIGLAAWLNPGFRDVLIALGLIAAVLLLAWNWFVNS